MSRESLTEIMNRYGSDKGNGHHNYTEYYNVLFAPYRNKPVSLLEIGIGTVNPNIPSSMIGERGYKPGASLRGWRDFFAHPDSRVYGCDIDRDILFSEERIETFQLDQTDEKSVRENIVEEKRCYDIIIDDGLHHFATNWRVFCEIEEKLNNGGIYVIEDILDFVEKVLSSEFVKRREREGYIFRYLPLPNVRNTVDNNLFVVRKR